MFPEAMLVGEVIASLCCKCMTEWACVVRSSDEWAERLRLDAQHAHIQLCATAGEAPVLDDVERLFQAREIALTAIRGLAIKFIKPLETAG